MAEAPQTPHRRARVAIPAVIAGGVSALLLAFSMTPTFAALTAAITNDANTAGTATLVMQESGPGSTGTQVSCTSGAAGSVNCSTINKFGGANPSTSGYMALKPGVPVSTTVKFTNTGSIPAAGFTVAGGTCARGTQGAVNGAATVAQLCGKFKIKIVTGSNTLFDDTATAFAATSGTPITVPGSVAPNAEVSFTITVSLDSSADATYQGLTVTQPITWTFAA